MKKLFTMTLMAVVLFAACTHENDPVVKQIVTIQASIASDSRVALGDGENEKKVSWTTGDKITLNIDEGEYEFTWQEGTTFAYSGEEVNLPALTQGMEIDATYVSTFSTTQTGLKADVGNYMALSAETTVAEGQNYGDLNLAFSHGTSVLKLTLSNEAFKGANVTDITLKAGAEVVAKTATETTFTGDADNGSVTVYFAIKPGTLNNVTLHATCNGNTYSSSLGNKTVVAGKLYTVDLQEFLPNYLIFVAEADEQSLTIQPRYEHWQPVEEELNLQYSTNGTDWRDLGYTEVSFENKKLFLRGTAENGTKGATIKFKNNIRVACSGDIRTLMNYRNYSDIQTSGNFNSLFNGCTSLTTAPALPATTLAEECYRDMFFGCTSLTTAPTLPATTLASMCYSGMFAGCTSLNAAPPVLPATTLAQECYFGMFSGCTSLTTAPALPATTLAQECYMFMFQNCTLLNAAPALPATTLENNCYTDMFFSCVSLTTAPALPATTLASMCYSGMFAGCTSLNDAPPVLPATTLASMCYSGMFQNCTLLTTAPALPATTLAGECYRNMFSGCTSLTAAPALPATALASQCYDSMFSGCTSLITAPELSATNLEGNCYDSMFFGCTSLTAAPALPATTLVWRCYYDMFSGCTNLSSVTMLATTIPADKKCLDNWLNGAGTDESATPKTLYVASGMVDAVKAKCPDNWKDAVQVKP